MTQSFDVGNVGTGRDRNQTTVAEQPSLRPLLIIGTAALLCVTAAFPQWVGSASTLLLLAPALAVVVTWRVSLLGTLFQVYMVLSYGLPWLVLGHARPPLVVATVVLWSLGLALGASVGRSARTAPAMRIWNPPRWPRFVLAGGLIAVQASLVFSGRSGYEAQLSSGASTPVGVLGLLASCAPMVTLMLLVTALASRQRIAGAVLLILAQATVLSLSGFRSAVAAFFIAVVATAALTLPAASPWRRPVRVSVLCVLSALIGLAGFVVGAHVRHDAAAAKGVSSEGTRLFGWHEALPVISARLDLTTPLQHAVERRDDAALERAVSWSTQLQAFIPRFLWSDKPVVDYGQQVTRALYGSAYGPSSSTITNIGDLLVNFGIPGVIAIAVLLGAILRMAEREVREGVGLPSLVLAAGLSSFILLQERPLILACAGLVRNCLVALVLWWASEALCRLRVVKR